MPRTRPPYPSEFRAEAVRLVRESGKPAAQIAMDLAISYESLRHISMREESAGFTLLELIIGLALLAVLAVGFFGLYTSGVLAGQHAQRLAVATFRAQSRLEYLTVSPAAPGEEVAVGAVFSVPADSQEKTDIVLIAPGLGQATTLVTWTWRGQERQTTLITLFRHP